MSANEKPGEVFSFSALEEALHEDDAGKRLVEELDWVAARRQDAAAMLHGELDQETHEKAVHLLNAFDAASAILKTAPLRKDI